MKKAITPQKARKMLSELGWKMIHKGKIWYSRNMRSTIQTCQHPRAYFMTPCKPNW